METFKYFFIGENLPNRIGISRGKIFFNLESVIRKICTNRLNYDDSDIVITC